MKLSGRIGGMEKGGKEGFGRVEIFFYKSNAHTMGRAENFVVAVYHVVWEEPNDD